MSLNDVLPDCAFDDCWSRNNPDRAAFDTPSAVSPITPICTMSYLMTPQVTPRVHSVRASAASTIRRYLSRRSATCAAECALISPLSGEKGTTRA